MMGAAGWLCVVGDGANVARCTLDRLPGAVDVDPGAARLDRRVVRPGGRRDRSARRWVPASTTSPRRSGSPSRRRPPVWRCAPCPPPSRWSTDGRASWTCRSPTWAAPALAAGAGHGVRAPADGRHRGRRAGFVVDLHGREPADLPPGRRRRPRGRPALAAALGGARPGSRPAACWPSSWRRAGGTPRRPSRCRSPSSAPPRCRSPGPARRRSPSGTPATVPLRVSNTGDLPAQGVTVTLSRPEGVAFGSPAVAPGAWTCSDGVGVDRGVHHRRDRRRAPTLDLPVSLEAVTGSFGAVGTVTASAQAPDADPAAAFGVAVDAVRTGAHARRGRPAGLAGRRRHGDRVVHGARERRRRGAHARDADACPLNLRADLDTAASPTDACTASPDQRTVTCDLGDGDRGLDRAGAGRRPVGRQRAGRRASVAVEAAGRDGAAARARSRRRPPG